MKTIPYYKMVDDIFGEICAPDRNVFEAELETIS